jgi:uroporphyrinogen-III synthase
MRLLVTRPEPDATRTAQRLRALGHEPVIAPLLAIRFNPPPADLPEPAALMLTSRNAVQAVSRWPQASRWRDRPLFVTGRGTGEAAAGAGFTDVRSADGDAADLAAFLMSSVGPGMRPILYPAARDRSEAFLEGLAAEGYDIRIVEAYRAETVDAFDPAVCEELRFSRIDGVLLYSRRTAEAFRRAVERARLAGEAAGIRLFVLSSRVAEPLAGLGADVVVAAHPDEESLLALLQTETNY